MPRGQENNASGIEAGELQEQDVHRSQDYPKPHDLTRHDLCTSASLCQHLKKTTKLTKSTAMPLLAPMNRKLQIPLGISAAMLPPELLEQLTAAACPSLLPTELLAQWFLSAVTTRSACPAEPEAAACQDCLSHDSRPLSRGGGLLSPA